MNTHLTSSPVQSPRNATATRRGFSLVEILLAILILGIGLIMVASVFPVGANWTRQSAENSISQNIAEVAVSVIQNHYGPTGDLPLGLAGNILNPQNLILKLGGNPFVLQALPSFTSIPAYERAYQFGASVPFPAKDPKSSTYFWTALARLDPSYRNPNGRVGDATNGILPSPSYRYDFYILIFHKGSPDQTFNFAIGNGEIPSMRSTDTTNNPWDIYIPSVYCTPLGDSQGQSVLPNYTGNSTGFALPPGSIGIGQSTGAVFHMLVNPKGVPPQFLPICRPAIGGNPDIAGNPEENVIWSCPANGTTASPLIYVYQTSLTF